MALEEYKRKRDLAKTPEPGGGESSQGQLRFVVQKHAASRLHYDFRLELGGVLVSWAVPKGPSLNPADKHLAMKVEDHPMDYRLFEGIIPEGNYGAGTVMVWDEGTYSDAEDTGDLKQAERNIKAGLAKGDLKISLHGSKLAGSFVLAKMKKAEGDSWLLIKHKDDFASTEDVTKLNKSVLTNRDLDQIKKAKGEQVQAKIDISGAPKKAQPKTISPMLATLAAEPFDDPDWIFEIKWDGYRILANMDKGKVRLVSRNQKDYSEVFAPITKELSALKDTAILDGEIVVVDKHGRSNFGALQQYQKTGKGDLHYYVFDVPFAGGHDLRKLPLVERKDIAASIVRPLSLVSLSEHVPAKGKAFFAAAVKQSLEGIMAKSANGSYEDGRRSRSWLKLKTHQRQEAVIGGYTEPKGSRQRIGALVLGVYEDKALVYVGHAGGGFSDQDLVDIHDRLKKLEIKTSPFSTQFKTNGPVHWVKPTLLAEVDFAEWTADGQLRQPRFVGLRDDKDPTKVTRELSAKPLKTSGEAKVVAKTEISNRQKLFWPKPKITKGDLADYYASISDLILPYLKDRPESMNRHPDGITGPSFYHKDLESHPDWIKTETIYSESTKKDMHWLIASDQESLLYMINLGCIELNPWHSRIGSLEKPDYCLIDLDAKTNGFADIVKVAQAARILLDELSIESYPKTSGKTGLHICIPLGAKYSYDQSRQFAQLLVNHLHERLPKLTSVVRNPSKRTKKIYLDYLQNRHGQTMAAPYCVRPVPGATVSTPLDWSEVKPGLDPTKFTIKTIEKRVKKVGDLWKPVLGPGIDMKQILSRL